ncbi:MAG: pyridoxal phosphate-dependent aminotransferase [Candidatus Scalindua sp.]
MAISNIISKIKPSVTLALSSKVKQLKSEGVNVIGFSAGEPDFDTPEEIKISAIESLKSGFTKYTPTSGIPELKEAICEKLSRENNINYSSQQILASCGAKQVIYNCLQAICNDGDEVLIPSPYWLSYPEQVTFARGKSVFIKSSDENDFKITKDDIERNITEKTKVLIINSPSNPTGSLYTEKELYEIVQPAVNAGLYVISDEIYEKIIYDGEKHVSPASFGKAFFEKVITVNGFSKAYSMTGWRIGYAAGPVDIIKAATLVQDHSTSGPNSFTQKAAITALQGKEKTITDMVNEFDKRRKYIVERLNDIDGITCMLPKGAFYVFPNISGLYNRDICGLKVTNSVDLANMFLEKAKIAFVPGVCFGSDLHLRISYATSMENIEEGMNRLEKLLNEGIVHNG